MTGIDPKPPFVLYRFLYKSDPMPNLPGMVILLTCLLSSITNAEDSVEFDVQAQREIDLFEGPLRPGFALSCKFALDRKNTNARQSPWIGIRFYSEPPKNSSWANVDRVALSVYGQGSTEFFGEPIRWHYVLFVGGRKMRDISEVIATASGRESVHTMSLVLLNETQALALVGEQTEEPWVVDFSPFELKNWKVIVSGLKGKAFCGDNTKALANP